MGIPLRFSTASQEVSFGVFVDEVDGYSPETGLTIANTDIKIRKAGTTTLANKNSGGATHISGGVYYATFDATDTGTVGPMEVYIDVAGARPVVAEFDVMTGVEYDFLYAAGTTRVDTIADQVWDELITGGSHNIATSAGRRLRTIGEYEGYNGMIHIDTVNGVAGTTDYENGTSVNPVDSLADALTLSASLNIKTFNVLPGSTITLAASLQDYCMAGAMWTLNLGGQDIAGSHFSGAVVSGIASGASSCQFEFCHMGSSTIPPATLHSCSWDGTLTLASAGDYFIHNCYSGIAGTSTPGLDFGAAVGNTNVSVRQYSGGVEIQNMGGAGTDTMSLEGNGQIRINANCSGGTVAIRGNFNVTDNASGAVTLSDNARFAESDLVDAIWDEVINTGHSIKHSAAKTLWEGGGTLITADDAQGPGALGASNQIQLAAGASSVDGAYDPAMIFIHTGTGEGQCRLIVEYDGTTRTATVDREWKVAPDATSEYHIIGHPGREHVNEGLAQAGGASTITLNALASSVNDTYKGQYVFIRAGTGSDQVRRVDSYVGATKVATMTRAWATVPDATSVYVVLPTGAISDECISSAVWDAATADHAVADSTGAALSSAATGSGSGDILYTHTEYESGHDAEAGYEIADVTVVVYSNSTATGQPQAAGVTDEVGQVKFYLDAGTYYLFRRKAGRRFTNPSSAITVS